MLSFTKQKELEGLMKWLHGSLEDGEVMCGLG